MFPSVSMYRVTGLFLQVTSHGGWRTCEARNWKKVKTKNATNLVGFWINDTITMNCNLQGNGTHFICAVQNWSTTKLILVIGCWEYSTEKIRMSRILNLNTFSQESPVWYCYRIHPKNLSCLLHSLSDINDTVFTGFNSPIQIQRESYLHWLHWNEQIQKIKVCNLQCPE